MKSIVRLLFGILFTLTASAETLTIAGSGTVATAITPAIEEFKKTSGIEVTLALRASAFGILDLAEGKTQIGLTVVDVSDAQRQLHPAVTFHSTTIGRGAIYLLVSPDVWDAGVHALSRDQVLSVIEKKVVNWTALGGPDVPVKFVTPGAGSLTNFATWLYGKTTREREATIKSLAVPSRNEAAFFAPKYIGTGHGVLGAMSEHFRPGESAARRLGIITPDGTREPTAANISSGRYPISFALQMITNGPPQGAAKRLIDFLLSEKGQALIEAEGYARVPSPPRHGEK